MDSVTVNVNRETIIWMKVLTLSLMNVLLAHRLSN